MKRLRELHLGGDFGKGANYREGRAGECWNGGKRSWNNVHGNGKFLFFC